MDKTPNNPVFRILLILCLSLALLMAQTNRMHMHLEHDDHSSVASGHIVDVHTTSTLHDFDLTDHHDDDQHSAAIDVSPDNLNQKVNLLNPLVLILLFIGLFLYLPRLICLPRQRRYQTLFIPCNYLLHPPLRAPPVK